MAESPRTSSIWRWVIDEKIIAGLEPMCWGFANLSKNLGPPVFRLYALSIAGATTLRINPAAP